jgi:hypothetical protein
MCETKCILNLQLFVLIAFFVLRIIFAFSLSQRLNVYLSHFKCKHLWSKYFKQDDLLTYNWRRQDLNCSCWSRPIESWQWYQYSRANTYVWRTTNSFVWGACEGGRAPTDRWRRWRRLTPTATRQIARLCVVRVSLDKRRGGRLISVRTTSQDQGLSRYQPFVHLAAHLEIAELQIAFRVPRKSLNDV